MNSLINFSKKIIDTTFLILIFIIISCNIYYMFDEKYGYTPLIAILFCLFFVAVYFLFLRLHEISPTTYRLLLSLIIIVGGVLRLTLVFTVNCVPVSDFDTVYQAGKMVCNGVFSQYSLGSYFHRFPHITFYSLTLGVIFKFFGSELIVIKIINVILKLLSIYVVSLIGKELFEKKGGLLCAFLLAFFPADIFYSLVLATENFALAFFEFSFYFLIKAYKSDKKNQVLLYMIYSGLMLAVGSLFRCVAPFYIAAYIVGIFIIFPKGTRSFSAILLLISFNLVFHSVSLAIYYSGITEYQLTDGAVPYSVYVLEGFNYETSGMYSADDHEIYFENNGDKEKINKVAAEMLYQRIFKNPEKLLPLFFKKSYTLWHSGSFGGVYWGYEYNGIDGSKPYLDLFKSISVCYFLGLMAFVILGIKKLRNTSIMYLFKLLILAFGAGLMFVEVQTRYPFAIEYAFIAMAASACCLEKKLI